MTNSELLSALSDMMDDKLQPIKEDVAVLSEDVAELKENVIVLKENAVVLKEDIDILSNATQILRNGIKILNLKMENDVSPRLQTIEECYTSTFYRYRDGIVQLDQMQIDIDALKSVVKDHSITIQKSFIP